MENAGTQNVNCNRNKSKEYHNYENDDLDACQVEDSLKFNCSQFAAA